MTLQMIDGRLDLVLEREVPAISWKDGKALYQERFSFPAHCAEAVWALFAELEKLPPARRAAHVRSRRRGIQWS